MRIGRRLRRWWCIKFHDGPWRRAVLDGRVIVRCMDCGEFWTLD